MIRDQQLFSQLQDTIERFVAGRLRGLEEQVDREDNVPDEIVAEMKAMGMFGLAIPEAYGGLGLTVEEEARIAMSLGHTAPAFRSVIATNNGIGSQGIVIDGTEAQKRKYLPGLASGELIGSFALTEPDIGSDAAHLTCRADRSGDDYVINGTKRFITNAPRASLFTLMARTDPEQAGAAGVSAFIVDATLPGISLGKPYRKMGQRGTYVCDVLFEDCRVPRDCIIGGEEGNGFRTAMKVLDRGRVNIAATCVGVAERLLEEALGYAVERRQFAKPIAEHQLIQAMLAESKAELLAARALVLESARDYDANGRPDSMQVASAKLIASEMVGRVADRAVQIHGGSGYISEYAVERLYRDVRLFRLYEGTSEIQKLIIARAMIRDA